jgi:hypothetical protein
LIEIKDDSPALFATGQELSFDLALKDGNYEM